MSESTLSISYDDLRMEIGRFLGYRKDVSTWSDDQADEVDRYIQAGIRQFYYPPAVEGVELGYEWSFLHPSGNITTEADVGTQDLPDDFGRVVGDFFFEASLHTPSITTVSEHMILTYLQRNGSTGYPRHASIRAKAGDGDGGQRYEVQWWPVPNAAFTLSYSYEAYAGKLTQVRPYPLGGMKHSELIVESCLAVAEQRANDERGLHSDAFSRMLVSAVAQDRRNGARFFGPMGGGELPTADSRCRRGGSFYGITYKGETW